MRLLEAIETEVLRNFLFVLHFLLILFDVFELFLHRVEVLVHHHVPRSYLFPMDSFLVAFLNVSVDSLGDRFDVSLDLSVQAAQFQVDFVQHD